MSKRILDLLFSILGLVFISPVLFVTCILIWMQDRHSPFYIAERIGLNGVTFRMVKLRSMSIEAEKSGVTSTAEDDPRVTKIGAFVRRFKIDEVAQLWNVFKGEMSIVGPRPNVPSAIDSYTSEEKNLLSVKPGITDFSSIVFADEGKILAGSQDADATYNRLIRPWKSRLGLFYIQNSSLVLDLHLTCLTFVSLFSRKSALIKLSALLRKMHAPEELVCVSLRNEGLREVIPPEDF